MFITLSSSMFFSVLIHVYVNIIFCIGKEKDILSIHLDFLVLSWTDKKIFT
jgi:hypothetical protein